MLTRITLHTRRNKLASCRRLCTQAAGVNEGMPKYAARNVIRMLASSGVEITHSTVAVCGVTFKENCPDIRNSKTFDLIAELQALSIDVLIVDPWADKREVERETRVPLQTRSQINRVTL